MPTIEDATQLDNEVVESPRMLGRECLYCRRILAYNFFKRDASYRDGRRDVCDLCLSAPKLSMSEHTAALRESNFNSEKVKSQRWANQDDYRNSEARLGRMMYSSDFVRIIKKLVPELYMTDGRVVGDIAVFKTGAARPEWGNKTFAYLFYIPTGLLPEFSQYEFDDVRDIAIREKQRGWRTPLLRLIECGLLREEVCNEVFGRPEGPASAVWHRQLFNFRNKAA